MRDPVPVSDEAATLCNQGGGAHSGNALPNGPTIHVTRPYLPPLDELLPLLQEIWERRWLTNHGRFHQRFEQALAQFLEVEHVSLTANGMLALETAVEASALSGEIITTPYSFVATTHAIERACLMPVFVDVRGSDLNIDADRIDLLLVSPERFALFSDRQLEDDAFSFRPFTRTTEVQWVEGRALPDARAAWLPADAPSTIPTSSPRRAGIHASIGHAIR